MLDTAKMDRLITIQASQTTRGVMGGETFTWTDLATVWAEYQPVKGREYQTADQTVAEVDAIFRLRYRDGMASTMRILFGQKTYDIQEIQEIGRRDGLQIAARILRLH